MLPATVLLGLQTLIVIGIYCYLLLGLGIEEPEKLMKRAGSIKDNKVDDDPYLVELKQNSSPEEWETWKEKCKTQAAVFLSLRKYALYGVRTLTSLAVTLLISACFSKQGGQEKSSSCTSSFNRKLAVWGAIMCLVGTLPGLFIPFLPLGVFVMLVFATCGSCMWCSACRLSEEEEDEADDEMRIEVVTVQPALPIQIPAPSGFRGLLHADQQLPQYSHQQLPDRAAQQYWPENRYANVRPTYTAV